MLHDDTRDGVEYIFGDRIAGLTQDADGVGVVFAGGGRRRFDLVVGADGLHSALRAMVFGPHERFVRHLGHVMAFYTVPNEFGLDRWLIDYQESGSGRSAGLVQPGAVRVDDEQLLLVAAEQDPSPVGGPASRVFG